MSFDQILEHIGGCGRYQILVLVLMNVLKTFTGYETLLPVIIAYEQDFVCAENQASSVPGNGSLVRDRCYVYRNDTPHVRVACSRWTYDDSVMRTTIRSQFDLVCGREYLASLSTTFFFLGFIIGCTLYGVVSDRFGRMVGMLSSAAHLFAFSLAAAFSPTFWTFSVLRFMAGIGNGGLMSTLFTMGAEVTDPSHRAFFSIMTQNGFSIGGALLCLLGFVLRDHFWLQIALALPMLLTVFLPLLIHESPRWLLTTGRLTEAEKAVRSIASINRTQLPPDFDIRAYQVVGGEKEERATPEPGLLRNFVGLFHTWPLAWSTLVVWNYWFIISLGYFGSYFTLGKFGGSIFLNLTINCLAEVPSRVFDIFAVKWWGRVVALSVCASLGGLTCLLNAVLIGFGSLPVVVRVISAFGQFFFNGGFELIWFYSGEVFPTVIRNVGVGIGSTWARVAGTIAPQAALLQSLWRPAPLIIMGALPLIGGLASMVLPETKDKALAETMADGEAFVRSGFGVAKKCGRRGAGEDAVDTRRCKEMEDFASLSKIEIGIHEGDNCSTNFLV